MAGSEMEALIVNAQRQPLGYTAPGRRPIIPASCINDGPREGQTAWKHNHPSCNFTGVLTAPRLPAVHGREGARYGNLYARRKRGRDGVVCEAHTAGTGQTTGPKTVWEFTGRHDGPARRSLEALP